MSNNSPTYPRNTVGMQRQRTQEMEAAGRDIHGVDLVHQAAKRSRKGECATCGIRLFKKQNVFMKKSEPLTIPGRVMNGRCLLCNPLDSLEAEAQGTQIHFHAGGFLSPPQGVPHSPPQGVPQVLDVNDDATYVSAITIDPFFFGRQISGITTVPETEPARPEPSVGFDDGCDPRPPQNQRIAAFRLPNSGDVRPPNRISGSEPHQRFSQSTNQSNHHQNDQVYHNSLNEPVHTPHTQYQDGEEPSSSNCDIIFNGSTGADDGDIHVDGHHFANAQSYLEVFPEEDSRGSQRSIISRVKHRYSVEEVQTLLYQIDNTNTSEERLPLLELINDCMWGLGAAAKETFIDNNGVDIMAKTLWADMTSPRAARAAASLLLALVAQRADDRNQVYVVTTGTADGLMDAWLVTMQTLMHDQKLQEVGCRIFCCLAAASSCSESAEINDGTLSGAIFSVLNAMNAHPKSAAVQEWGIRALYNQCVYSRNAEPNKRTLASATLENGVSASIVLQRILECFHPTDAKIEWCCKLYWVLSASADVNEMLVPAAMEPIREMVRLLSELQNIDHCMIPVQEAILGALSNFAMIEENRCHIDPTELVLFACKMMRCYNTEVDILYEGCYLITSLASGTTLMKDAVVEAGGVQVLLDIVTSFRKDAALLEVVLGALVALSLRSDEVKAVLCKSDSVSCILHFFESEKDDLPYQEVCCSLLASMYASGTLGSEPVMDKIIEHVYVAMTRYADSQRVNEAGCKVIADLSFYEEYHDSLAREKVVKLLLDCMCNFPDVESIHASACCAFWKLNADADIQVIVATLKNHMVHEQVVHMACGSLWSIVHGSDEQKEELTKIDGGLDAIACVLIMYADAESSLLEIVSGLLTSLTVRRDLVETVVGTEAFTNMVDVMRSDNVSAAVLGSGALFLRNVCLAHPELANEALRAIPAILQGIQSNMDDPVFQREACSFLWLAATQSNDSKSKILALDGITVLMNVLERYTGESYIEEALGAFRVLTLTY